MAKKEEKSEKAAKPAPMRTGAAKERPRKPKLRGVRPPRGLCLAAGLHYPNTSFGHVSFGKSAP